MYKKKNRSLHIANCDFFILSNHLYFSILREFDDA